MTAAGTTPASPTALARGGLALSALAPSDHDATRRAALRQGLVHRLGLHVPLFAVQDVGVALADRRPAPRRVPRGDTVGAEPGWAALVERILSSEASQAVKSLHLAESLVAALTVEILRPALDAWPGARAPERLTHTIEPDALEHPARPAEIAAAREDAAPFLAAVALHEHRVELALERLDLDTLRLMAMLDDASLRTPSPEALSVFLRLFHDPVVHDVVNFTLEVLPSVMDAREAVTSQSYAVNGYRGISRSGTVDDLMLTELAHDPDLFVQRYLENELFYNERERTRDHEPEEYLLLIDGTASMRGRRNVFARGVALAMVEQLVERKRTVRVAFFDSTMHPPVEMRRGAIDAAHILGFRAQRGRDYERAFEAVYRAAQDHRERRRAPLVVTIITHGRCLFSNELAAALAEHAEVNAAFVLPDGRLPGWCAHLDGWQTVDLAALAGHAGRIDATRRVLGLVDRAGARDAYGGR